MLQCGALGCAKLVSRKRGTRLCRFALKAVSELQTTRGRLRQTSPEWVIVMTSSGSCLREMDNGGLVRVLEDWDLGSMELSAVFAGGGTTMRAARAFTDHLIEAFVMPEVDLLIATREGTKRLACPDRRPIG